MGRSKGGSKEFAGEDEKEKVKGVAVVTPDFGAEESEKYRVKSEEIKESSEV